MEPEELGEPLKPVDDAALRTVNHKYIMIITESTYSGSLAVQDVTGATICW